MMQAVATRKINRIARANRVMENEKKGVQKRKVPVLGLVLLVLVGVVRLSAQNSVEARLAALEARIQELESELAVAKGMPVETVAVPMQAPGSKLQGAFIRPAGLSSPATMAMAS